MHFFKNLIHFELKKLSKNYRQTQYKIIGNEFKMKKIFTEIFIATRQSQI